MLLGSAKSTSPCQKHQLEERGGGGGKGGMYLFGSFGNPYCRCGKLDIFNQTESLSMQLMTSFHFVFTDLPVQNVIDLILQAVCSVTLLEAALNGLSHQISLP
jgi:hypothetical protein